MIRGKCPRPSLLIICASLCAGALHAQQDSASLRADALRTLKKAATYYHTKVASHGGYVYYYDTDLQERWGEGKASLDILFVQPPGTPAVGMAYLKAYEATNDDFYLKAAHDAAETLVYGQLQSGGWTQIICYGPAKRVGKYRNGKGGAWNASALDDDQTQAALRMLAYMDRALGFKNAAIHEAAMYGFDALLKAQFANGAFPQIWIAPVAEKPILKAKFPDYDWKTEGRVKNYWDYYTLNDNLAGSVAETLITAHEVYKDEKYKASLERLGDFLILAQMPEPQPGWCQQYNYEMIPIWARKFEPAAITGLESQDVMETLITIYIYTGKDKYLAPIPRALEYYQSLLLPDGKIPRFIEFKTNKPLYMDAGYKLTYDDSAAPSHYGWKQPARFKEIEKKYQDARKSGATPGVIEQRSRSEKKLENETRRIIQELDAEGRWISTYAGERLVGQPKFQEGFRFISSEIFNRNVETLSSYISAIGKQPGQ